jgi:hypothetical protein
VIADRSLAAIVAAERRSSRHPVGAACIDCGTTFPIWLAEGSDPVRCLEHLALSEGRPATEQHAIGGLPSPIVVEIGVNLHALLTVVQRFTWRAAGPAPGSPEAIAEDLLAYLVFKDLRP